VDILLSLKRSQIRPWVASQMVERQTAALETIAARLVAIDVKLERVAAAMERDANPATHPF
jgi:hypothetical protein